MSTTYTFEDGILTVRTGRDPASGEVIATTRRAMDELGLGSGTLVILDSSEMRSGRSSQELHDLADSLRDEQSAFDITDDSPFGYVVIGSEEPTLHALEPICDLVQGLIGVILKVGAELFPAVDRALGHRHFPEGRQ